MTLFCTRSEVSAIEGFRLLVQNLSYRCSSDLWMFCHQKQTSHLKRSPYHSALMGCPSLQVTQEWNKKYVICNSLLHMFTCFFPTISELTYLHEKRGKNKPIFCTSSFTVFNQLLQNPSQKVMPCTLKDSSVQRKNLSRVSKFEARSMSQIFAAQLCQSQISRSMTSDYARLQRPLQYSYRNKTVTVLIVTLGVFSKEKQA